jgi:hypothetical protein
VTPYRILVTGSRDWPAPGVVWSALNDVRAELLAAGRPLVVVHGACPTGADAQTADWAVVAGQFTTAVVEERHPADWRPGGILDRGAGFRRNAAMVQLGADVTLAFIKDGSRGASHTVRLAEAAGIPVRRWTA